MIKNLVKKFRIGTVKASIWENDGAESSTYYTVDIVRSYKDKEGKWQETASLKHDDLMNVAKLMQRCEALIAEQAKE